MVEFTERQEKTGDGEGRRKDNLVWEKREKFAKKSLRIEDKI